MRESYVRNSSIYLLQADKIFRGLIGPAGLMVDSNSRSSCETNDSIVG